MAIVLKELMKNISFSSLPIEHQTNGLELLKRINIIRDKYGKPLIVTSGYRTKEDHIRIYKNLASQKKQPFDEKKIPWGSLHLSAAAVDILDRDGNLYRWLKDNPKVLEEAELWCEEDTTQPRVHFQIFPPKSGKRWFLP